MKSLQLAEPADAFASRESTKDTMNEGHELPALQLMWPTLVLA